MLSMDPDTHWAWLDGLGSPGDGLEMPRRGISSDSVIGPPGEVGKDYRMRAACMRVHRRTWDQRIGGTET